MPPKARLQKGPRKAVSVGEVIIDPRTFLGEGRIVDPLVREVLESIIIMPPAQVGRLMRNHLCGLSDSEAALIVRKFCSAPDEATGLFVKTQIVARLSRQSPRSEIAE